MELLYEIEAHIIDLAEIALTYAEPFFLEIVLFLFFSTFVFGFLSTYK